MSNTTNPPVAIATPPNIGAVHEDVHQDQPTAIKNTICIAVDYSSYSEHAVEWTLENLATSQTMVILLNVRPYPYVAVPELYIDIAAYEAIDQSYKNASHEFLKKMAAKIKAHEHGIHVRAIALSGDPREELLFKINELKPNMVVVGSRGMSALKRAFVGSVSDFLVHHSEFPVIVTRSHPKE